MERLMEILLIIVFALLIITFCGMFMNKLYPPVKFPPARTKHRDAENRRRKRWEREAISQTDYFKQLKSSTAESVRGFNSDRNKTAEGL